MNIRYLKIFMSVVNEKTMSAAARQLHMTEPSVSQAINEMERYYGVRLFDRLGKKLYLTNAGYGLITYADEIVTTFDDMEVSLKNSAENPTVRFGGTSVFSTCFLPSIAGRIKNESRYRTDLRITVTNTYTIEQLLLRSELDFGVVEGIIAHPDLKTEHLLTDRLCLICGKSHPFYGKKIKPGDLAGQEVISREGYSYLTGRIHELEKRFGLHVKENWKCSGNDAILAAVRAGLGITIISSYFVADDLANGDFYEIPIEGVPLSREWFIVHHRNKFLFPALQEVIEITKECAAEVIEAQRSGGRYITE